MHLVLRVVFAARSIHAVAIPITILYEAGGESKRTLHSVVERANRCTMPGRWHAATDPTCQRKLPAWSQDGVCTKNTCESLHKTGCTLHFGIF